MPKFPGQYFVAVIVGVFRTNSSLSLSNCATVSSFFKFVPVNHLKMTKNN